MSASARVGADGPFRPMTLRRHRAVYLATGRAGGVTFDQPAEFILAVDNVASAGDFACYMTSPELFPPRDRRGELVL
jgi:hypothetical protein